MLNLFPLKVEFLVYEKPQDLVIVGCCSWQRLEHFLAPLGTQSGTSFWATGTATNTLGLFLLTLQRSGGERGPEGHSQEERVGVDGRHHRARRGKY